MNNIGFHKPSVKPRVDFNIPQRDSNVSNFIH
jgi:hypothetical protein